MERIQTGIKLFFWFAFLAFLGASIPHVAYFFRAFEPLGGADDNWWWIESYGIAVSIDLTVFLLSVTVAQLHRQGRSLGLIVSVWAFILALSGLSWFINYKYAMHFINTSMISPTKVTLPFINILIPDVNPVIASCFQVLAIAYTWISDKIAADEKPKTAAELEAEANELASISVQKQRIAAIKKENNVTAFGGLIDTGADVFGHFKSRVLKPSIDVQSPAPEAINEQSKEATTEELELLELQSKSVEEDNQNDNQSQLESGENVSEIDNQNSTLQGLSGRSTISIEEAATILQCEIKTVKALRASGKLKTAAKNNERITVASIKSYAESREKVNQRPRTRRTEPQLRAVK